MIQFKNFFLVFLLTSTAASAAVIVKGLDTLSIENQDKVFNLIHIQKKHIVENEAQINADLAATLPGKNLNAYWIPDTLYQVIQSYYDTEGINNHPGVHPHARIEVKQAQFKPQIWKKSKQMGDSFKNTSDFKTFKYPTSLKEHKDLCPSVVKHWARLNNEAHKRLGVGYADFKTNGFEHALTQMFNHGPGYQEYFELRESPVGNLSKHTSFLKKNENFLKHALKVEIQAHNDGKILLWRYARLIPGTNFPDSPFKTHAEGLEKTLSSPLEYYLKPYEQDVSFAGKVMDSYFSDGAIHDDPFFQVADSACTFSIYASYMEQKNKGKKSPDSIVYSWALSPEKVQELNNKLILYYPREAVPQQVGIYSKGEGFHPRFLFDYQNKENVQTWLDIMQSDALQVHFSKGTLQADYKNNQEVQRLRNIYGRFLNKAKAEAIVLPKKDPIVPPVKNPVVPPKKTESFSEFLKKKPTLQTPITPVTNPIVHAKKIPAHIANKLASLVKTTSAQIDKLAVQVKTTSMQTTKLAADVKTFSTKVNKLAAPLKITPAPVTKPVAQVKKQAFSAKATSAPINRQRVSPAKTMSTQVKKQVFSAKTTPASINRQQVSPAKTISTQVKKQVFSAKTTPASINRQQVSTAKTISTQVKKQVFSAKITSASINRQQISPAKTISTQVKKLATPTRKLAISVNKVVAPVRKMTALARKAITTVRKGVPSARNHSGKRNPFKSR